jgi:two-component system LytT family response regulator
MLVDDESSARGTLRSIIREFFPDLNIIAEAETPGEAIRLIPEKKPDLVFLDVEMQHGTGFDVLENLPEINFQVIFVTAYEQYALRSFRYAALDYLLKPVRISQMKEAIARFREKEVTSVPGKSFESVRKQFFEGKDNPQLILPEVGGFFIVNFDEIVRCESSRNYTIFHLDSGESRVVSKTIKEYEEVLIEHGFYRVHKSHIISLKKVRKVSRGKQSEVELTNGDLVPIARDRKESFFDLFKS